MADWSSTEICSVPFVHYSRALRKAAAGRPSPSVRQGGNRREKEAAKAPPARRAVRRPYDCSRNAPGGPCRPPGRAQMTETGKREMEKDGRKPRVSWAPLRSTIRDQATGPGRERPRGLCQWPRPGGARGSSEKERTKFATWLILPVAICSSQRLSHASASTSRASDEAAKGSLNQSWFTWSCDGAFQRRRSGQLWKI